MFKGLSNLASLMRSAHEMQSRMAELQESLRQLRVEGSAGGGMVKVEVNGQQQVLSCRIEPELFGSGDREVLEDLIVAATNQALEKAKAAAAQEMSKLAGDVDLTGLGDMLEKFGMGQS
jgi:DNA-binding YbaB/EbfC family protein